MNQDLVRLDRFDGSNFTRWQDKVRFLLTALKIFYILDPTLAPLPEPKENDAPQVVAARKKREEDELICRGHILNALSDRLYDLYTNTNSAREIWRLLKTSTKPRKKLKVLKIELPEAFQVGAIVAKLPSSWKGYRKRILHKSEDYSLEEIQKHLRIEEESRSRDKMVEESNGGTNKANAISKANHPRAMCALSKERCKDGGMILVPQFMLPMTNLFSRPLKMQREIKRFKWAIKENPSAWQGTIEVFLPPARRLAHVGLSTIKRIVKCGLIACDTKKFENDLCELNGMLTRGGNRIPMKKNEISPYELWKGRKPNIGYFKVWGCLTYCKKTDPNKTKLGPRAIKCAFVGYASNSKAYRLLDLESNVIIESREVEFFENLLSDSNSQVPTSVGESQEETLSKVVEQPIVPRKSQRARKEKVLGSDEIDSQRISFYLVEGNREDIIRKIPIVLQIEEDPKTYKEAMTLRDVAFWKEAINDEMDSIMSNQTWELVDLPPGSKPIGCKWVFRRKYHTDGMIQTFKARLVAKGFKQREGIDYFDTYAPVARTTSIRILFALASIHNLFVHQMDVKTAFLNGDLNEEVYMEQPEGFVLLGNENKVFSKLSRFTSNPSVEHWKAIGRVLGYLKNTKELSLQYSKFPAIIEGYSDASWISSVGDNLSTTGVVPPLMRVGVSFKKVHEWIEHMAIKVLSKKIMGIRVVSGSVVLLPVSLQGITGLMLQATWRFQRSFVTITLR
ncbi:Retrovirus-related Pol polyprotein from transposon TNT 1-94 [Vitis vinifera]|uniref:Retrovirus-related Pol polyprotein from transposon TNT 1-94 n=1 Tax=Vitis vinifera TaxID=29760 RepID=A0A438BYF3_VITVI|nr:Retrovirus-related Pol polyprotein from transposon TNT 1-94 [Vitis vinifera]